jgi:hypothetical protein
VHEFVSRRSSELYLQTVALSWTEKLFKIIIIIHHHKLYSNSNTTDESKQYINYLISKLCLQVRFLTCNVKCFV